MQLVSEILLGVSHYAELCQTYYAVLRGKEHNEIFHLGSGFKIACHRLKVVEKISGNSLQQQLKKSKSKHAPTLLQVPKEYKKIIKKGKGMIHNKSK